MKQTQSLLSIASSPLVISIALFFSLFSQGHNASFRWVLMATFLFLSIFFVHLIKRYKEHISVPVNSISVICILIFIWQLCSIFWSPVPSDSFQFVLTSSLLPLAFYAGFQLSNTQKPILLQNLTLLVLIVAFYTCYQSFVLDTLRPSGFFLNWNTNAAFMGMILLPLCSQYLLKTHYLSGLVICFLVFSISLTISRGALAAVFLGLILIYSSSWKHRTLKPALIKLSTWLISGFIISNLALSFGLQQTNVSEKIFNTLQTTVQSHNNPVKTNSKTNLITNSDSDPKNQDKLLLTIASGRHYLWDAGWRMYLDKPILGWGFGMYHWLYPQYRDPLYGEHGQLAHNDYLQFLLELGPIGLALLLSFVFSIFIHTWHIHKNTHDLPTRLNNLGYSSACIALLVHTGLTFHLYQAAMLIILGLYLGLLNQNASSTQITPKKHIKQYTYYSAVGGIGLFFTLSLFYLFTNFNALPKRYSPSNAQQTLVKLESAIKQVPFIEEFQALQSGFLLNLLTNSPKSYTQAEKTKLIGLALHHSTQAIQKNPLRANNYYNQAMLLSMLPNTAQRQQQIQFAYQKALQHNPYHLQARINYAQALFQQNQNKQAKRILKQGLGRFYSEKYQTAIHYLQLLSKHSINNSEKNIYQKKQNQLTNAEKSSHRIGGYFTL